MTNNPASLPPEPTPSTVEEPKRGVVEPDPPPWAREPLPAPDRHIRTERESETR